MYGMIINRLNIQIKYVGDDHNNMNFGLTYKIIIYICIYYIKGQFRSEKKLLLILNYAIFFTVYIQNTLLATFE